MQQAGSGWGRWGQSGEAQGEREGWLDGCRPLNQAMPTRGAWGIGLEGGSGQLGFGVG